MSTTWKRKIKQRKLNQMWTLKELPIECQFIASVFLYFVTWLAQKTQGTSVVLKQSNQNQQPITTWSPAFSRASSSLFVFTSISLWLIMIFSLQWLAFGIALDLALWHSFKKHSSLLPLVYFGRTFLGCHAVTFYKTSSSYDANDQHLLFFYRNVIFT